MRLIDADETRKKMLNSLDELFENVEMTGKMIYQKTLIRTIIHHIDDAQTIDAEPVKHGHWIHCPEEDENAWRCSECTGGWLLPDGETPEDNYMRFCHRCGAKMDGGAEK